MGFEVDTLRSRCPESGLLRIPSVTRELAQEKVNMLIPAQNFHGMWRLVMARASDADGKALPPPYGTRPWAR